MNSRAAFEAWISAPPFELETNRYPDDERISSLPGQYLSYETELAWEAWQKQDVEIERLRAAAKAVVTAYSDYRKRGVMPAPGEYQRVVETIAALEAALAAGRE